MLSERKQGLHFLLPDFLCCHVSYACLYWNGKGYIYFISDGVAPVDLQKNSDVSESETVIFLLCGETKGNF